MKYILRTRKLKKIYENKIVIDDVDLSIQEGQIYGFIGANGAGKTTIMRLITGLSFPSDGEIELFGETGGGELAQQRKRIGCIIESPALYADMTAMQNLEIQRVQRGIPGKACTEEVLQMVNLVDTGRKKVKNFSLGMKQRLALAIALLGEPEFLILDEPINGLDPAGIIEFREFLRRLNREKNVTILISSHILNELHQLADCYGIIHEGKLIKQVTALELDEECKKHIHIQVDDSAKAIFILENQLNTKNFKVYPHHVIKLYDYIDEVGVVSTKLVTNGVTIESIGVKCDDLETYFTRLTGGEK